MKSGVIVVVALALLASLEPAAARPQPVNPPHLSEMPTVDRVKAEITGRNRLDTAARQVGAFWQLRRMIEMLAGPRIYGSPTPDENRLIGAYMAAYRTISQAVEKALDADQRRAWYQLHTEYEASDAFREELLARFFSRGFREAFRRAEAEWYARARARAAQRATPARQPGLPAPPPSGRVSVLSVLALLALPVVILAARRRRAGERHARPSAVQRYYELGVQHFGAEQYAEAIQAFKQSIARDPTSAAYNELGRTYFALKESHQAVAAYKEAIRLKADNAAAHFNLRGPAGLIERTVTSGLPFMTNGCPGEHGEPGCTRPYGSYRPSEPFRDYPFVPSPDDLSEIRAQLILSEICEGTGPRGPC